MATLQHSLFNPPGCRHHIDLYRGVQGRTTPIQQLRRLSDGEVVGAGAALYRDQELAAIIRDNPNPSPLPHLMRIIKQRLGVELPHEDLAKLFGGETVYILLRLEPRFQADKISREVLSWPGVECVDEVYGDADMVVKARVDFTRDNLITRLRQRFSEAIRDIRVLVTD
jgi:hypothetical protein